MPSPIIATDGRGALGTAENGERVLPQQNLRLESGRLLESDGRPSMVVYPGAPPF